MSPKNTTADLFLIRSFKQLAAEERGGPLTVFLIAATAIKETWISRCSLHHFYCLLSHSCNYTNFRESVNGNRTSFSVLIILQSASFCMLLSICFTNSLPHLSQLIIPVSPPVKGESLACIQRPLHLPGAQFCLSSNIHPLSLSRRSQRSLLSGLWLVGTQWWMYGAFVSGVCIASLHYSSSHATHWKAMIFWEGGKVLFLTCQLILERE